MKEMTKKDLFLRACRKEPVERTPVWLMRQAGRYLPSYRAVREKAGDFLTLCRTPELATEAALRPVREFDLDAAIVFSDILVPLEAMGIPLSFAEGEGPRLRPVASAEDVGRLRIPDPSESMPFVMKTIESLKTELGDGVPVIGFGGAPFTLACYALEGGSSRDFRKTMQFLYSETDAFEALLDSITSALIPFLDAQARAGADAIQLFESWGGLLNSRLYRRFALPRVRRIFSSLKGTGAPLILYANGASHLVEEMASSGADVLSLDSRTSLSDAHGRTSGAFCLQGNLEPSSLFAPDETLRREISDVLAQAPKRGHIFNLGHGVLPGTPPDKVKLLVETVELMTRSVQ